MRVIIGAALGIAIATTCFAQSPNTGGPSAQSNLAFIAPTPLGSDNSNRIATTAYVQALFAGGLPLASSKIFIGSAGGLATAQSVTGDCALTALGAITCTKSNGSNFGTAAFQNTGTSGANIPLLNVANTWASGQTIPAPLGIVKSDVGLGNVANVDTTNASNISTGTIASARGGAGVITGALKGNGSGVVSQAACADLSNAAASCSTDTTTQANVAFTGLTAAAAAADADTLPVNQGASNLKQTFAAIKTWIKSWIAKADVGLSNVANVDTTNAANLSSGTLLAARMPALTGDCVTTTGAVATTCTKTNGVSFTGYATATYLGQPASWTIDSGTVSAATSKVISLSGSPTSVQLLIEQLDVSANADVSIQMNGDTGSNYQQAYVMVGTAGTTSGSGGASLGSCRILPNLKTGFGSRSTLTLNAPNNASVYKHMTMQSSMTDNTSGALNTLAGGCVWASAAAITSITVITSAGNFSFKYQLVGYK